MKNRYPTPQELYALEQKARHLRAAEIARLFGAAKQFLSSLLSTKVVRHA